MNESLLDLQITIFLVIGAIIFVFVCLKMQDLRYYLPSYLLFPLGYFFYYLHYINNVYRLIGNLIFIISSVLFLIGTILEYSHIFKNTEKGDKKLALVLLSPTVILLVGIQIILMSFMLLSIFLLIKIFKKTKTPRHMALIIFQVSGILSVLSTILDNFQVTGAWEFSYLSVIIFATLFLTIPIVAYFEQLLVESGERLKESEERYRLITENVNDLIAILNEDYKYEYINEPIHQKTRGRSNKDLIGTTPLDIIHPDDIEKNKTAFKQAFRDGESQVEARIKNLWGGYNWFEVKGKTFKDVDGKKKLLIISRDITTRKKAEKKLRDSEEKYRILFENAQEEQDLTRALLDNHPDFIYFKDRKARFRHVSKHFFEFFGISRKDIIGKTDFDLFPEELAKITHSEDLQVINTGTPLINKEESTAGTWVLTTKIPWLDKNGNIKGLFGISRDITERKKAEQKLIESEEKFRNITEQAIVGIAILHHNEVKYLNKQLADVFGYTIDEIMSWGDRGFLDVIHPEDRDLVMQQAIKKQSGDTDIIDQYQFRGIKKNGEIIWLEIYSKSINYEGAFADFAMILDITEQKNAEERLRESEEKFSKAFHKNSTLMALSTIEDGRFIDVNESFLDRLGYQREEVIGHTSSDLNIWAEYDKRDITIQELKDKGSIMDIEIPIRAKNGDIKYGSFTADIIEITGKPLLLTLMTDITDRKIAEQKLKESEKMYRNAYEQATLYRELLSHDIRNILQVVNSSAELLSFDPNGSERSIDINSLSDMIKTQVKRGTRLISNVHKLSEIDEAEVSIIEVEVLELLEHVIKSAKRTYHEKIINIQIDSAGKEYNVHANDLLEDVFENLLINGVNYNNSETIEISIKISKLLRDTEPFVKIEFMDNGIGVDDRRKKLIFQKGNREYKGTKGMGLGLSLVTRILESYNGEIWVEDKVKGDHSKGSNFVIVVPEAVR